MKVSFGIKGASVKYVDKIILETVDPIDMPFIPRVGDEIGLMHFLDEDWQITLEEWDEYEGNPEWARVEEVWYEPAMLTFVNVSCRVIKRGN